ncbi:Alpha/beta hydrolase fold-1 [Macrophomina phaseolina MS6]|uniref:Alpha/beta hydrolase fold-1 n=2 Tax=Macrophomina phaseolina TaxID=35725 RepID=K2STA7_MACPH|nr:Alpha/beta hydrolase fold-1 [Macrophomina phaseolina MS6]KAH7045215.1 Alpha/Beta hydrolase protein [Macrophomina phaseolina]
MAAPTLSEHTFTHSGDLTTFYWSAGPTDGPLLIFIHGWPANGETWKPQLLALAALGFRTIAPDCRGYGRSSVPPAATATDVRAYAIERHVSDMLALLQHLGRQKALWIGHDWGAGLVWGFAEQHPECCVGVTCMAVPYGVLTGGLEGLVALSNREIYPADKYPYAQWDYQVFHATNPALSAKLLAANVPNTVKALYQAGDPAHYGKPSFTAAMTTNGGWWYGKEEAPETPLEDTLLSADKGLYERLVADFEKNGFEGPDAYYLNHDVNREYSRKAPSGGHLHFPVLFIEARYDVVCDTAISRLSEPMRERCTNLTETSIDSGHWVALEKPAETNAAIVRWIATKLPTYFPGYWKSPFASQS